MKVPICIMFLLSCTHAALVTEQDSACCQTQKVGEFTYSLIPDDVSREFPVECEERCAYKRDGDYNSPDYCMKPGDLPSSCIGCLMVDKTITKTTWQGGWDGKTDTAEDCFNICQNYMTSISCAYIRWRSSNRNCALFSMTYEDNIGFTSGPQFCSTTISPGCLKDEMKLQNINKVNADPKKTETPQDCQALCQADSSCGFFQWESSTTKCKLWTTKYKNDDQFTSGPIQCGA